MIDFQVNGSSAANGKVVSKGFTQPLAYPISGGKLRRVLLAEALKDNNNTNISCTAYGSLENIYSEIITLISVLFLPDYGSNDNNHTWE